MNIFFKRILLPLVKITIFVSVLGVYFYGFKLHKSFKSEVAFISQFCKSGDCVFDVGANMGRKTDIYLACGVSRVICIEPQPKCIAHLRDKYIGDSRVVIIPKGLSNSEGTIDLMLCSKAHFIATCSTDWTRKGSFADHGYIWDSKVTVSTTTLDDIIKKYGVPQFCKIDVENFEPEVLAGLSQPIPMISFEYHEEYRDNIERCLTRLSELGYKKFNFAAGEDTYFSLPDWVSANEVLITVLNTKSKNEGWPAFGDIYAKFE